MKRLTKAKIAMVAAGASVLTSAIHGGIEAVFGYDSATRVLAYTVGRVAGDIPVAIVCFGVAFGLLTLLGVQQD